MNEATLQYVRQHSDDDVRMLALRGCKDPEVDLTLALQQIQGRQTARCKLPTWAENGAIVYPPHLNMEQCSSEPTARYKAAIARRLLSRSPGESGKTGNSGNSSKSGESGRPCSTLLDLTGGFGVDFTLMSEAFTRAVYVEHDAQLFAITSENLQTFGKENVQAECADGVEFLHGFDGRATMIFLDPARRDDHGARTYDMADCTPNVLAMRDELLGKADYVMLKLSPMLDWRKAVSDLGQQQVQEVHIVSVGGECKELLVVLCDKPAPPARLFCVNDDDIFEVEMSGSTDSQRYVGNSSFAHLLPAERKDGVTHYLYEPNASIMKAGCFAELSARFAISALAPNSHLFISPHFIGDFPGRRFHISTISSMNKHELKNALQGITQANITVRNFPLSVAELRKRLKLSEGGSTYIFATTLAEGDRVLLLCSRL